VVEGSDAAWEWCDGREVWWACAGCGGYIRLGVGVGVGTNGVVAGVDAVDPGRADDTEKPECEVEAWCGLSQQMKSCAHG
jgi:hypothetical protein